MPGPEQPHGLGPGQPQPRGGAQEPARPSLDQETVQIALPGAPPAGAGQPPPEQHAQPMRVGPPPPAAAAPADTPKRSRRKVVILATVVVLVAALGATAVLAGPWIAQRLGLAAPAERNTQPPPTPTVASAALRPLAAQAPAPSPQGVAAALTQPASAAALGTLTGSVLDASTGTVLWDKNAAEAMTPASTGKLLTAAAALLALDHQARLSTTVVAGPDPGTVVLVGGGDPTLSALPAGKPTFFFPEAARLNDLVDQVKANAGGQVRKVLIDVGRYTGPPLAQGWLPGDVNEGHIAPMVPLMLDAARRDPLTATTPRSDKPALAAGQEFAKRLGAEVGSVAVGTAGQGAKELGKVQSPPLGQLVQAFLQTSDNVLAEAVARELALGTRNEPSFAGAAKATLEVLKANGLDLTGVRMSDGSGLSTEDKVPARFLSALLTAAAGPGEPDSKAAKLRPLLGGLPVAGGSGTLAGRYADAASSGAKGWVRAKTGTLSGVNSLAGVVSDADGRLLVFALMSASPAGPARPALDAIAATLHNCGCR